MSLIQPLNSPVIPQWNLDDEGNKTTIQIDNEKQVVINGKVLLNQIPDKSKHVIFTDRTLYEININEQITEEQYYKIDYNMGIIYLHPSLENQTVYVKYFGKGILLFPLTRIFDPNFGTSPDMIKTLQDYIDSINEITYGDTYDDNIEYKVNKMVYYNGSTYLCIKNSLGHLPADTTYWRVLSAGFYFRGDFDYNAIYAVRDLVNFGIDKTVYECIQPTSIGESPINTPTKWKKRIDTSGIVNIVNDYTNDVSSLYIARDNSILITHNLNDYPLALVINTSGSGFGEGGFGEYGFSNTNPYQILSKCDYPTMNTCNIYLNEQFTGTPTITQDDSRHYTVTFTDATLKIILK